MNIKRIIREEMNNDLLMEGKLNDMFKKFNMTQIKKELKERLDIDETSTKMEVAKKLIKYLYKLNLKLLKYELGAVLGGFIFYFLSIVLDVAGVEPFVTDGEPTIPHFILWGAGALLNVIRMVRKDLKEEDGMEWIKDVKSNQDIAQEIVNETEIIFGEDRTFFRFLALSAPNSPYTISFPNTFHLHISLPDSLFRLFSKYCQKEYGLDFGEVKDTWNRYEGIVMDKFNNHNNLKESDDMDWIRDAKSNQDTARDIAQEIANETYIKDNEIFTPFISPLLQLSLSPPFLSSIHSPRSPLRFPLPSDGFIIYCKEQYGSTKEEIQDIWDIYSGIMLDKINNLNESDDMEWIKDTVPEKYRFFEIYVCYDFVMGDDENDGECTDGSSTFLKIPSTEVYKNDLWDFEVDDLVDSIDGVGIINWASRAGGNVNSYVFDDNFRDVEYVKEISKEEYCNGWGRWNDKDMCNNTINESDDMEWIKDTKSNQDIAQEIADKSEIKNGRLYPHSLLPSFPSLPSPFPSYSIPIRSHSSLLSFSFFIDYCKEEYGLNINDIEDIWDRYKEIIFNSH